MRTTSVLANILNNLLEGKIRPSPHNLCSKDEENFCIEK